MTMSETDWGLPDPDRQSEFYADVPVKRLVAWLIDSILIGLLTGLVVVFTVGLALFIVPFVFLAVGFAYRWITIAQRSATPGMRMTAIEFRGSDGARFDSATAGLHTLGYTVSVTVFPLQLVSIIMMLVSERKQGLTDHLLGTAAINRPASF